MSDVPPAINSENIYPSTISAVRHEVVPQVGQPRKKIYQKLELEVVENPDALQQAESAYREEVGFIADEFSFSPGDTDSQQRQKLAQPTCRILKDNQGDMFWEMTYGRVSLVVDPRSVKMESLTNDKPMVTSYPVRNIFVTDRDGSDNVIDLLSLRKRPTVKNYFTFSHAISYFEGRVNTDGSHNKNVLLSMTTHSQEGSLAWDPETFLYIALHENGHAERFAIDRQIQGHRIVKEIMTERGAHLVGLLVSRRFPTFVNPEGYLASAHHMMRAYDRLADTHPDVRFAASREKRAIVRAQLRSGNSS